MLSGIDLLSPGKYGFITLINGVKEFAFNTGLEKRAIYFIVPEHTIIMMVV